MMVIFLLNDKLDILNAEVKMSWTEVISSCLLTFKWAQGVTNPS